MNRSTGTTGPGRVLRLLSLSCLQEPPCGSKVDEPWEVSCVLGGAVEPGSGLPGPGHLLVWTCWLSDGLCAVLQHKEEPW